MIKFGMEYLIFSFYVVGRRRAGNDDLVFFLNNIVPFIPVDFPVMWPDIRRLPGCNRASHHLMVLCVNAENAWLWVQ